MGVCIKLDIGHEHREQIMTRLRYGQGSCLFIASDAVHFGHERERVEELLKKMNTENEQNNSCERCFIKRKHFVFNRLMVKLCAAFDCIAHGDVNCKVFIWISVRAEANFDSSECFCLFHFIF